MTIKYKISNNEDNYFDNISIIFKSKVNNSQYINYIKYKQIFN